MSTTICIVKLQMLLDGSNYCIKVCTILSLLVGFSIVYVCFKLLCIWLFLYVFYIGTLLFQ